MLRFGSRPTSPDAHLTTMRQAFDGVAMMLFVADILTESLLRNEIYMPGQTLVALLIVRRRPSPGALPSP